ncbi:MAG: hypothetical protein U9R32_04090 [Bacteroidota bacterium]|nr:hypothetical protein [Bacteroidota bacterium]
MKQILFILLFLSFAITASIAQDFTNLVGDRNETEVIFVKEKTIGLQLHSYGFGFTMRKSWNRSAFRKSTIEIEGMNMKDSKEIKSINPFFVNSKGYYYGKLNNIFMLKGLYGIQKQLNDKPYWGGVNVSYFYRGGINIAFAKPVYLYIIKFINYNDEYYDIQIIEERYDPEKHFPDIIYGRAPFTKGLDEISVYPGLSAKGGVSFEFGSNNQVIKNLETGAMVDFFPVGIPVLAMNHKRNFFVTLFINFTIGKRYN